MLRLNPDPKALKKQQIRQQKRQNEIYKQLKFYCRKMVQYQSIDNFTILKLWTENKEGSPLKDPKELYKDKEYPKDPTVWTEIKSPTKIFLYKDAKQTALKSS